MKPVLTWQGIGSDFHDIARAYPSLSAQWREVYRSWILRPDLLRLASGDFGEASTRFKATATSAVTRLNRKSKKMPFSESWHLWLDLLREHLEAHERGDRRSDLDVDSAPGTRDNFGEPGRYTDCGAN